jgi:hypothetical protein
VSMAVQRDLNSIMMAVVLGVVAMLVESKGEN